MANEPKMGISNLGQYHHFLIVVQPIQSHINPARHLAHRLLSIIPSCHVTLSTAISAHRKMFHPLSSPDQEITVWQVTFIPYSDGYDMGFDPSIHNHEDRRRKELTMGPKSLSAINNRLAECGRHVTCIIQALFLPWVVDVALAYGITSILYWIQPAMVLSICYYYFYGHDSIILSHKYDRDVTLSLPGLFPLKIHDLPTFLTIACEDHPLNKMILSLYRDIFESLDRLKNVTGSKPKILINNFEELEAGVLPSMEKYFELYIIGPLIQPSGKDEEEKSSGLKYFELYTIGPLIQPSGKDEEEKSSGLFKMDDESKHMKWLDSKPERSVVYVSFGGVVSVSNMQLEEVQSGLKDNGFSYIWVVRKDSRVEGLVLEYDSSNGIIIEWRDQVKVLNHPSVGCFLTHYGWNSTLESLMCGVPLVGIPQLFDQPINAKLAGEIGVGVRGVVSKEEEVVLSSEIKRCLELVMSDDAKGAEMRRKALVWKGKAREAMETGGSSETNLQAFVEAIAGCRSQTRI